jgi:uncharacterized protein YdeI (YjbR/CyaY-like superfamily)
MDEDKQVNTLVEDRLFTCPNIIPSMSPEEATFFPDRASWRRWLARNHDSSSEVWILAYKVHTGKKALSYSDALDEALCYGWIDSRMRRIDDEKHMWRFAPRKPNSIWSLNNRRRVEKLISQGRMRAQGLAKVEAGKRSGRWDEALAPSKPPRMPGDLTNALKQDDLAWRNFKAFANSYRTAYIYWVISAKREETRRGRIDVVVEKARQNKKHHMIP